MQKLLEVRAVYSCEEYLNFHTPDLLHSLTGTILKVICNKKYWYNICISFTI